MFVESRNPVLWRSWLEQFPRATGVLFPVASWTFHGSAAIHGRTGADESTV